MASLTKKHGKPVIQFGKRNARKTIHLGRNVSSRAAESIRSHVEHLEAHKATRHPLPAATLAWVSDISPSMHSKLVKAGLVLARPVAGAIGEYTDRYIKSRTDLKPATIANLKQARSLLVKHFGAKRDFTTITRGEIGDWHRELKEKFATATIATHIKKARQFFADAVDRKIITDNPLKAIKVGSMANAERQMYIPVGDITKVIAACPDAEWRLIFALARFAGLRTPSEIHKLRWTDIHWDERMLVRSPKTEHHEGKAAREVPIFPELLPYLREAFEAAEDGAVNVIARHRGDNLGTQARRIIERAGVLPWPRLFQNLRSSCETDLTTRFPLHVVCAWIGNTASIAMRHYLQVTDAHFEAATKSAGKSAGNDAQSGITKSAHKTQNAPKIEAFHGDIYPQGESNNPAEIARLLKIIRKEMVKALARLRKAAPHIRQADIQRLERELAHARKEIR